LTTAFLTTSTGHISGASDQVRTEGFYGRNELSKDYDHEKWVKLYKMAILGLERAKLTGRIDDARMEMAARIVKLRDVPGLHAAEISAIDNAYRLLRILESEEERYAAEEKRRTIEEALRQVRSIAPKIEKLKES
jgi:hypothetical protein